jgi:regulator of sigma E protease
MLMGVPITQPKVARVVDDSVAAQAGFQPGDLIKEIDGRKIDSFVDVQRIVTVSAGVPLSIRGAAWRSELTLSARRRR